MPLKFIKEDITEFSCDAVVEAVKPALFCGIGKGRAKIMPLNVPAYKYLIKTGLPEYTDGAHNGETLIRECCRNSLRTAFKHGCESIALSVVSFAKFGYSEDLAFKTLAEEITSFVFENEITVYLSVGKTSKRIIEEDLYKAVSSYIDEHYEDERYYFKSEKNFLVGAGFLATARKSALFSEKEDTLLTDKIFNKEHDESFSEMLLRKIDESGMTDAACYKKANIDRRLFSKIRSDRLYKPSKTTAIALAIALELSLDETKELLMRAGFALSPSYKFDVIIEYFITNGNYDIHNINETLFSYDQPLLGG